VIVPYKFRLLVLSLAAFFLVHVLVAALTLLLTPAAMAISKRLRPRPAARLLLGLRLFPAVFALIVVAGICVPSYLWLEPREGPEPMGWPCLAAAMLGGAVWIFSIARSLRAAARSVIHAQRCRRMGRRTRLAGECIWMLEGAAPLVMLAGILRPRLVISRSVVSALSSEQLAAVLSHENAHRSAHDNFKRLLVLLAPGVFPFVRGFGALEHAWAKVTEWAADDQAAAGDQHRSLTLAAALVQVARLGVPPALPSLANSLMANGLDLSMRVDRLLNPSPDTPRRGMARRWLVPCASLLAIGSLVALMAQPATLYAAHEALEAIIR
jgi:Zn-dependent protease with chaperone function